MLKIFSFLKRKSESYALIVLERKTFGSLFHYFNGVGPGRETEPRLEQREREGEKERKRVTKRKKEREKDNHCQIN